MIDIEAENRLEENQRLLREKGSKVRGQRELGWRFPPIKIIAGNKCDLKDSRVVSSKVGWEWAKSKNCGFMETSAREMVNIEETFACEFLSTPMLRADANTRRSNCPQSCGSTKTARRRRWFTATSNSLRLQRPYTQCQRCWYLGLSDACLDAAQPTTDRSQYITSYREIRFRRR